MVVTKSREIALQYSETLKSLSASRGRDAGQLAVLERSSGVPEKKDDRALHAYTRMLRSRSATCSSLYCGGDCGVRLVLQSATAECHCSSPGSQVRKIPGAKAWKRFQAMPGKAEASW